MIAFPNCKINLGLYVAGRRPDGFHHLETVFYPLPLCDVVEIIPAQNNMAMEFILSGIPVEGDKATNLCMRAYRLLQEEFPQIGSLSMHLHKVIPTGAGLGGGSSDAAFTLRLLNNLFDLRLDEEMLKRYALRLGSDCPFFIVNKPCYATGRGEILEPVAASLDGYQLVLVNPGIHVSTRDVFSRVQPKQAACPIKEAVLRPPAEWRNILRNDLEEVVFDLHPAVAEIKTSLYLAGAVYAAMTGSGSTVFAIFEKKENPNLNFPKDYMVRRFVA